MEYVRIHALSQYLEVETPNLLHALFKIKVAATGSTLYN